LLRRIGPLTHLYALLAVMGGWVLFRCETLAQSVGYYAALAGSAQGQPARHPLPDFLDPFVLCTLVVAVVFATPLARHIGRWRDRVGARGGIAGTLVLGADIGALVTVFLLASAFLAAGTYNPFIYFRF
jgi:alginate O-acetyltransferase complex protein AlgI